MIYTNRGDIVNYFDYIYEKKGGDCIIKGGSLLDNRVYYGKGLKYTVILEKPLGTNCSGCTIRKYIKLPQKYEKYFFEDLDD